MAAIQGVGSVVVVVRYYDTLRVESWILGAAMDSLALWPRDVGDTAHIYFRKVDCVVPDGWWRWSRSAVCTGVVRILYEEIIYILPHTLEINKNAFIHPFFSYMGGLLLTVDIGGKIRR